MRALESRRLDEQPELARPALAEAAIPGAGDAPLLGRLLAGDGDALAALVQRHGPTLFHFAFRISGSREAAEEVVQDAFMRLAQRPPRPRDELGGDVGGWLRVVTARLAANARRSERRRSAREDAAGMLSRSDSSTAIVLEDPQKTVERIEARRRVRQALDRLPERQRLLLLLRHSGFRYSEIAAVLGIAPGSIGTLLIRAEQSFRATYGEED